MQTHSSKRILSFFLAILLVMGIVPLSAFPTFAATSKSTMQANEITSTAKDGPLQKKNSVYIINNSKVANYSETVNSWQAVTSQSWMTEAITDLTKDGTLLGINYSYDGETVSLIPTEKNNG